ncbi:hypothetical protein SPHINGO8BC_20019 [Sphingobacterium multivorum]|uniref:Uncharacterized protein n=1 Tax=Sphingobacterium multivorum TaxID=28454 RepID=A0A654B887_SPHMU|nr:hypothetical protein SPHINGO8BC_20019 [Sphingobacterium multivorum]
MERDDNPTKISWKHFKTRGVQHSVQLDGLQHLGKRLSVSAPSQVIYFKIFYRKFRKKIPYVGKPKRFGQLIIVHLNCGLEKLGYYSISEQHRLPTESDAELALRYFYPAFFIVNDISHFRK